MNLIVEAALLTGIISEPVKKLKTFISIVRNFPKQMDKLKKYFKIENTSFKMPFPDCTTR